MASLKKLRFSVFLFLVASLFLLGISSILADEYNNLPLQAYCNYSTGTSRDIYIGTGGGSSELASILRIGKTDTGTFPCSPQVTISGFNEAGDKTGSDYINDSLDLNVKQSGFVLQNEITVDPDKIWTLLNLPSGLDLYNIAKLRFVEDPFVLLNISKGADEALWGFHTGRNLVCQATLEKGQVNSTRACVEYTLNKKFANCRGDIAGDFKCCGDDDLIDPGFEATDAEKNLYVWETAGDNCQYLSYCTRTGMERHSGEQSFQIIPSSSVSNLSQELSLGNGNYYLSFWVKVVKASPVKVYVANDGGTLADLTIASGSYDWKNYILNFSISAPVGSEMSIKVLFSASPTAVEGAKVLIDDVHIMGGEYVAGLQQLTDYAGIFKDVSLYENPYLCYYNNTQWEWMNPVNEQFKILNTGGFDMISNSILWHACNANGLAEKIKTGEDVSLTANYGVVSYVPPVTTPTIVTYGEIETQTFDYGVGGNTVFIPDNEFEPGIAIQNIQPTGAPDHCFNKTLDIEGNESDVDCGDGCAKCFDGQKCNTNDDCISGICVDDGTGQKRCIPQNFPEINQVGYIAKRFICSNMDEIAAYTECCGYSLGLCMNQNINSEIRRTGNPLSSIFEFPVKTDSINYVLLMGLPYNQPVAYYNYPLRISKADNPLYNWTNYSYLEFYIAYAVPQEKQYLRLLILKNVEESPFSGKPPTDYINESAAAKRNLEDDVLFRGYIDNFITGQVQPGKWMRVRIPINVSGNKLDAIKKSDVVKLVAVFAYEKDVPMANRVTHTALSGLTFRNVIAIDRINLVPSEDSQIKYCSKFPPNLTTANYWESDMDQVEQDVSGQPIGKGICENTPGFGWTGNACCGDDLNETKLVLNPDFVSESYADSLKGCAKGFVLGNNSAMILSYNNSASGNIYGNASLMFYNSRFYSCNNQAAINATLRELAFGGTATNYPYGISKVTSTYSALNNIATNNTDYPECYNQGSWYCDYDSVWKNSSALPNLVVNSSSSLPFDLSKKACCPAGWCFYGNRPAPSSCVPSQADIFQYSEPAGIPYFFNSSTNYSGIPGDDTHYRCISGSWAFAELKWNPDNTDNGYCPERSQCYVSATDGCVDSGYFKADNYCEKGNWSSRTKLVARQLLEIARESTAELGTGNLKRTTLYCDLFDSALAQVDYFPQGRYNTSRQIITGNGNCAGTGLSCANNFCALKLEYNSGEEKTYVGTSLNIPADTTNTDYSILRLFDEALSTPGRNHLDFCDMAIIQSNTTGNYTGCNYSTSFVSPGQGEVNIWLNNATQTIIYSKEAFDISNTITSSDFFSAFIANPIYTIFQWARTVLHIGGSQSLSGEQEFLTNLSKFSRLYISRADNKEILGDVELKPQKNFMAVGYKNIEANLCYGNSTRRFFSFQFGADSSCNVRINNSDFWQNVYTSDLSQWKDLTTDTRIEGTFSNPGLASTVSVSGPGVGIEGETLNYAITITKATGEQLIAVSVDFGDGTAISMGEIPESGIWGISHTFTKSIKEGEITAGILGSNYGISADTMPIDIIPSITKYYTINENTAGNPSELLINLSVLSDWPFDISQQDDWLNCNKQGNIITCSPEQNQNILTKGIGNFTISVSTKDLPIQIYVSPVNTPPTFSEDFPSLSSPEDISPVEIWHSINLLEYVSDFETAAVNLSFSLAGDDQTSSDLLENFSCGIENAILNCTSFTTDDYGTIYAKITVSDTGEGNDPAKTAEKVLAINITAVNDAPVFIRTLDKTLGVAQELSWSYPIFIEDVDNDVSFDISLSCSYISGPGVSDITPDNGNKELIIQAHPALSTPDTIFESDTYNCTANDTEGANSTTSFNITVTNMAIPQFIDFVINPSALKDGVPIVNEAEFINISMLATWGVADRNIVEFNFSSVPAITDSYSWTGIKQDGSVFSANFSWNTSNVMLPISHSAANPAVDSDAYYLINFTVNDSAGVSSVLPIDLWINRRPALNLSNGTYVGTISTPIGDVAVNREVYVFNGAYVFHFNASDISLLKRCKIDFDDGNLKTYSGCPGTSFFDSSMPNSLVNHSYYPNNVPKTYVVTLNVTDSYGALSTTNITLVYEDNVRPTADITLPEEGGSYISPITLHYSSGDDTGVSYCGYFTDRTISDVNLLVLYNADIDELSYISPSSCVEGAVSGIEVGVGEHNITFFAVDTMGRARYKTVGFTVHD